MIEWKPVKSVGVPTKSGFYIVTDKEGAVFLASRTVSVNDGKKNDTQSILYHESGDDERWWNKYIIAWSDCPEPYME